MLFSELINMETKSRSYKQCFYENFRDIRHISLSGYIYIFYFLLLVFNNDVIKKNIKLLVNLVITTRCHLMSSKSHLAVTPPP